MWRRTLVAGLLGSTAMLGAYVVAGAWIEREATSRLDALSQQLPSGTKLQWQRIEAQPFSLGLKIEQIRLALPEHRLVREVMAGELVLAQTTPDLGAPLGRARASDVRVTLVDGGELVIGAVAGRDVDVQMLTEALRSPDGLAALIDAELAPLELTDVSLVDGESTASMARLAIGGYADRRLVDFAVERLEMASPVLGTLRLAELSAREIDVAAPTREPWPDDLVDIFRLLDRATLAGIKITGLNYRGDQGTIALVDLGLGHAGGGRLEGFTVDGLGIADALSDGHMGLDRLELALLDWRAVDLDRLAAAATILEGETGDEENADDETEEETEEPEDTSAEPDELAVEFAGLEVLGQTIKVVMGPLSVEGFGFADGDSRADLRNLQFGGQSGGHAERLLLEGLSFSGGEDGWTLRLGQLAQEPVQFAVADLAERLAASERTPEALQELTVAMAEQTWQTRTTFRRIELQREELTVFGIEALDLAMSEDGTKRKLDFSADNVLVDLGVVNEHMATDGIVPSGIDRLIFSLRLKNWLDSADQGFEVETFAIDAPGLGASSLSLRASLGADLARDPTTALSEGSLVGAELRYRDAGYVERWLQDLEADSGEHRDLLVAGLIKRLRAAEPGRSLLDQERGAQLEAFLKRPRTLIVSLKPAKPVPFSTIAVQGMAQPRQLVKTVGLQIRAESR